MKTGTLTRAMKKGKEEGTVERLINKGKT